MAEVISLLTSSDDEEASASPASVPAPALTQRAIRPKKRPASRAKRGNWRRRAGDASTAERSELCDYVSSVIVYTELHAHTLTALRQETVRRALLVRDCRPETLAGCLATVDAPWPGRRPARLTRYPNMRRHDAHAELAASQLHSSQRTHVSSHAPQ